MCPVQSSESDCTRMLQCFLTLETVTLSALVEEEKIIRYAKGSCCQPTHLPCQLGRTVVAIMVFALDESQDGTTNTAAYVSGVCLYSVNSVTNQKS